MTHEQRTRSYPPDGRRENPMTPLCLADLLHDGLVQWLALALIELDSIQSECVPSESVKLANARVLIRDAIRMARRTIRELQEPQPADGDLNNAIAAMVESLRFNGGSSIAFSSCLPLPTVPSTVAADLTAASRELLINARKHAPGASIHLTLRPLGGGIELMVADDGAGLSGPFVHARAQSDGGYGLKSVGRRLEQIGANFHLQSQPGSGLRACIRWPGTPLAEC